MVTIIRGGIAPVRIRDKVSGFEAAVNSDGRLSVDSSTDPGRILSLSAFNDLVLPGSAVTLVDYMAASDEKLIITGLSCDGSANGIFELFINGIWTWRGRNSAANPTAEFNFPGGFETENEAIIELKVKHSAAGPQQFAAAVFAEQIIEV